MKQFGKVATKSICVLSILLTVFLIAPAGSVNAGNAGEDRLVTLNFNDVDISVFINLISDLTGKSFIIDQRVKGKISVISPAKITVDEAYKVFLSVLEIHGFTTVEAGKVIKIVASPEARSKNIETLLKEEARSPEDKVITQLVQLRYADPEEIRRLFAPLISKNSVMLAYANTNTLIITDVHSNIQRLLRILDTIDVPGVGQVISVIPLENGDATKLVRTLSTIFQEQTRRKSRSSSTRTSKFVADERTNSIIVLASEDDTNRVKKLLQRLDKEIPRGTEKIRVYYLENATAEDLAKVLQSLSSGKRSTVTKKGKKEAPIVSEKVNITADKATNSLIIMAEKEEFTVLEDIIKKLDIPRSMVYIECLIMEVNVDKGFTLGGEWVALGKTSYDGTDGAYGGGFSGGGTDPYSNIGNLVTPPIGTLPSGYSLGIFSEVLKIGDVSFPNLAAIIQAYRRDENVHILSTPQILTTDNEEAKITVGRNVPYLTKSGSSTVESYNTYEYKDVGITLKITPQISKDRDIRLKIAQEVTKLSGSSSTEESRPTTLKRTIETTVIVHDKNTIAIGGLIDDSFTKTENKVPCLGDIPGLGWFFKAVSKGVEKTNLFIFLTPHVIANPKEAKKIYEEKRDYIEGVGKGDEDEIEMYPTGKENADRSKTIDIGE